MDFTCALLSILFAIYEERVGGLLLLRGTGDGKGELVGIISSL